MRAKSHLVVTVALIAAAAGGAGNTRAGGAARKEAYGFRFVYADKLSPKEYLQKHPCVSGTWRCDKETDTHYLGVLSYPTGNVPPTYPTKDEAAFQVEPIRVEKQNGLGVDLKTWQGQIILLQPDAAVRFGTRASLKSSFKVVGFETEKGKGTTFLFKKQPELKFARE